MPDTQPRKRGRPRKHPPPVEDNSPKRGRGRPPNSSKKEASKLGPVVQKGGLKSKEMVISVTPIVLQIDPGKDVAAAISAKIEKLGTRVCILSASGAVSDTELWAPSFNGQKVVCQGHFHIVSMSGILLPNSDEDLLITVGIASDDGKMFGGALAGPLIAATKCSVVLGKSLTIKGGTINSPSKALLGG